MPEDTPTFSTKPLEENKTKPKIIKKRHRVSKKTLPNVTTERIKTALKEKEQEMGKRLNSIYQNGDGQMPNMTRIKIKKTHPVVKFFLWLIIVGAILSGLAWAGFMYLPNNKNFSEDKISLIINGPTDIVVGATSTYTITIYNEQDSDLNDVILSLQYPKGFIFVSSTPNSSNAGHTEWDIDNIQGGRKNIIYITGRTFGAKEKQESWRVAITYRPSNFNYQIQKNISLIIEPKKMPIAISVTGPDKISANSKVEYTYKIKKDVNASLGTLDITPIFSPSFNIASSSPALAVGKQWTIDTSTSTDSWTFKISGQYASTTETKAEAKATLSIPIAGESYQLAETVLKTQLAEEELDFNLAINGSIGNFSSQPGQTLNFTIYFKNDSKTNLKDGNIKLTIDGPSSNEKSALDWPNIKDKYDGDIKGVQLSNDTRRGEIYWDKEKIPNLASPKAGQDISINVSLPIRDIEQFDLTTLKTFQIKVKADMNYKDSSNISRSLSSNQIIITLNSDLSFETRDSSSQNSAGLTEHKIKWILTNNFHPLKNITVSADAYGDINWKVDSIPPAGQIDFNSSTKKITWIIADMPESVDILSMPFTITINKNNPTQNKLVSKVNITAEDTITKEKITLTGNEIKLQ
jgi:hypothetical protein